MFTDVLEDVIFADFLVSAKLDVDPSEVLADCRELMASDEGVRRSNGPETWHSNLSNELPEGALGECVSQGLDFADAFLRERCKVAISDNYDWWVNSTKFGGYNSPHIHGKCEVIGLYYPKVPPGSSDLTLVRTDGSSYHNLFMDSRFMNIKPIEGRFYLFPGHIWHYVEAHTIEDERVSISFNLFTLPI